MCLRAMISNLREQLEAEKRFNAAVKEKKVMFADIVIIIIFIY